LIFTETVAILRAYEGEEIHYDGRTKEKDKAFSFQKYGREKCPTRVL